MSLTKKYRLHEKDTGSTVIQAISLNAQIKKLIEHGNRNRKVNRSEKRKKERWNDVPARRALLKKTAEEKKLLKYLAEQQPDTYAKLKEELK